MPLHSVALEQCTHFIRESSKQFDELYWWVKIPVICIGAYVVTKSFDFALANYFGKYATQADVDLLNNQLIAANGTINNLTHQLNIANGAIQNLTANAQGHTNQLLIINGTITQLQQLNPDNDAIPVLKTRIKKLEKDARAMTVNREMTFVLGELRDMRYGAADKVKKLYASSGAVPTTFHGQQAKEASLISKKRKKGKEKEKEKEQDERISLSLNDEVYKKLGAGTPREEFSSASDDSPRGEGEK